MAGQFHDTASTLATGDARIDTLFSGSGWDDSVLYYAFPDVARDYEYFDIFYGAGENSGFFEATTAIKNVVALTLDEDDGNDANDGFSLEGFTDQLVWSGSDRTSHIRVGQTTTDPYFAGTAWGYLPGAATASGDVWFSNVTFDFSAPAAGDYAYATIIHELGHALGLKHPHETDAFGPMSSQYDAMEYTIMSYNSYVGADDAFYTNEEFGYAQSFMMLDIAALQHMYGANFSTNSGDTVYSWTPGTGVTSVNGQAAISPGANRIFATIWDGGGTDTYDLSAYSNALQIDLAPGGFSIFSTIQLAELDIGIDASGNIYNALQYQGDPRSLVENATGGSGNDSILGNSAVNTLIGNSGNDHLEGLAGEDDLRGGKGSDKLEGGSDADTLAGGSGKDILLGGNGQDTLKGGSQNDRLFGGNGDDRLSGGNGRDKLNAGNGTDRVAGGNGNDLVQGGGGKDSLFGGDGNDTLVGGTHKDQMTGGAGEDVFRFDLITDSTPTGSDEILDFEIGIDLIDLSGLTPGGLDFVGSANFSGSAAEVRTVTKADKTIVAVDTDGDGAMDFRLLLAGITDPLGSSDFLL